jgi:hypothetical protein
MMAGLGETGRGAFFPARIFQFLQADGRPLASCYRPWVSSPVGGLVGGYSFAGKVSAWCTTSIGLVSLHRRGQEYSS